MRRALPFLFLLVVSCGGKIAPSSSDETIGSDGPTPDPAPIGGPTPSPSLPPSPTPAPTGTLPPKPENATYTAYAWAGGLDHIDIFKADFTKDICVHMHLTSPGDTTPSGAFASIITPADWSVRIGDRSKGASNCKQQTPRKPSPATAGKGTISWAPVASPQYFPCKLDVHAALLFDDSKAAEQLDADGVAVQGCL
jgi:hypothetical protein